MPELAGERMSKLEMIKSPHSSELLTEDVATPVKSVELGQVYW